MDAEVDQLPALMARYAIGEDEPLESLYRRMAPHLYRFLLRLGARIADADDDLQETFLRLHRARATYRRGANPMHWAYAIARSVYLDRLRRQRRRPQGSSITSDAADYEHLLIAEHASPEADARASQLVEIVARELNAMSEKLRAAYVLVREEGLGVTEAAALLGATGDAVKQRVHRACEQIRSALTDAGWQAPHAGV